MALQYVNYVEDNFPIETDWCNGTYELISNYMSKPPTGFRESGLYGIRILRLRVQKSGLYRVKAFRSPKSKEILFGTIYNGNDYAEVRFSKAQNNELGKLEITLCGNNKKRLMEIQNKIQIKIKNELNSRKK